MRNSASGNGGTGGNYSIAASNRYGAIIDITSAGTAAVSGNPAASVLRPPIRGQILRIELPTELPTELLPNRLLSRLPRIVAALLPLSGAAHGQAVDLKRWLAHADRHALPFLAAGADAGVER